MEINAITLATADMAAAVRFWQVVGLELTYGGADQPFSSLRIGDNYVNLTHSDEARSGFWGRVVFHVPSPDELHAKLTGSGYLSLTEPADAPWGERYFHILDPDGHELSFARLLTTL
jgi:catechol 2,3-dioxygenase-like lactoylglutathione lyase family enzyme